MLVLLNFLHEFNIYKWPLKRITALIKAYRYFSNKYLKNFFFKFSNKAVIRASGARALFLFILFHDVKFVISKNFIRNELVTNTILSRFIFSLT